MEKELKKYLPKDGFTNVSAKRSKAMAAIKGKGNKSTECRLRFALVGSGISGWKLHAKSIPGNPDFFFPKQKMAVFVDGCFWHGCPVCGHYPKKNRSFWKAKITLTQQRDINKTDLLQKLGFKVIRFWEHELSISLSSCIDKIREEIAQAL